MSKQQENENNIVEEKIKLENLTCAHCAGKIEDKILKLEEVKGGNFNFTNQVLTVQISENQEKKEFLNKITSIVESVEDGINVFYTDKKNKINKTVKTKIKLENLTCAHCAGKIEDKIFKLEEVKGGNFNFANQILTAEINTNENKQRFIQKIKSIVDSIENGINVFYVEEKHSHKQEHSHGHTEEFGKLELIGLITAIAIYIISFFIKDYKSLRIGILALGYFLAGGDIVFSALKNLRKKQMLDENFLMTIASMGAFAVGEYPEAVGVMIFYKIGEYFQSRAVNSSRSSIQELMDIRPDYANIYKENELVKVDPEEVSVGDLIIVKPGEKVPLDGVINKGKSMLDTSALTGESVFRTVRTGDEILSGSINKNGTLEIEVTKTFYNSTVSKILDLVENAGSKKGETEKFITKFSRYYTPIVVAIAIAVAVIPSILMGNFSVWLYRALIFLVVSCPCAIVVSVPLGFFAGIGNASRNGILIKGSNYLEALNKLKAITFDKTGTLTKGTFNVVEIKGNVLEYAAYAESFSNHPIAISILNKYDANIDKSKITHHEEIEGNGINATIDGKDVLVGNSKLMNKNNITFTEVGKTGTVIYVAVDKEYKGYILIADEIKKESEPTINDLNSMNIKTYMLTGDNKKTALSIAQKIGIGKVFGNLLPGEKVEKFEEIQKQTNGLVAFVGDGINDAPVLARADIGIAMGGIGSDAAIEAADIVLMEDSPLKINTAIKIAKKTRIIVMENIVFALSIKIGVMILGVFGLATMWHAIFADVGVAILAILNSMRILKSK